MSRSVKLFAFLATAGLLIAACGDSGPSAPGAQQSAPGTAASPAPAAPAAGRPAPGGTLTFVLENDVINFDPLVSRAFVDRNVHYQIYDSLVRIDAAGKIIPWLAEKWEFSDGDKTVTLSLRKNVTYHDGTAFDADSVKWNIDRYRTAKGSARSKRQIVGRASARPHQFPRGVP